MIMVPDSAVRVLLVEDDPEDADITQRLLKSASIGNYIVDWREGFDSALEAMSVNDYDVMLLDFRLSGESGLDLLRAARDRGTRSPAILLTGQIDRDLDFKAMQAGVVDFLEKDHLKSATLERSVRYAAGRGRADRERLLLLEAEQAAREEAEEAHAKMARLLETLEMERTALRNSEAFFRAAFLSSAVASLLVAIDGTIMQSNRAMTELLGYKEGALRGKTILDVSHPDDAGRTDLARAEMVAGLYDTAQVEKRYVHNDGSFVDVSVAVGIVRRTDGQPSYFTSQVFDISSRKRAERAVAEREQRLGQIVAVQQEVATAALDNTIMDLIADRAMSLTSAQGSSITILEDTALICQAGSGTARAQIGTTIDLDASLYGSFIRERAPLRCDDLSTGDELCQQLAHGVNAQAMICIPLFYDDAPMGVLSVFSACKNCFNDRDVHALQLMAGLGAAGLAHATAFAAKQALVVERTAALNTLGEREAMIRTLIENAADPLITLDEKGRISYASPALERLLGRGPSEFLGVHPTELCHLDDRIMVLSTIAEMVSRTSQNVAIEARFSHRDGSYRTVRITGRNMLDDKAVRGIIVNLHDMTDEVVAASQLRQSQKLEAVGQLAGGVAHDFNNLLTVISGHSEFLVESMEQHDVRLADVVEIRLAADRAAALTRQLLAFSRQQMLQPKVVDMNTVVSGMQPMLQRLIGEDIAFVVRPAEDRAAVLADPSQLEQVVMNLAINARDSMPRGGKLTVEVQLVCLDDQFPGLHSVPAGDYVMLAITDTGMGMSQEVREQIFDPFFTTKASGKGTGLGLSTVYGIVKQSNGYIAVYSEPGLWSAFKVYLPLVTEEAPQEAKTLPLAPSVGSETILLVEDEEAVRSISRRILKRQGYHVLEARDGIEALEVAAVYADSIDLLVTDVVMPRMNGRALAERLSDVRPGIPVLYLSGYTNDEILRRNPAEDGPLRLLQKPFTTHGLSGAVREAITAAAIAGVE